MIQYNTVLCKTGLRIYRWQNWETNPPSIQSPRSISSLHLSLIFWGEADGSLYPPSFQPCAPLLSSAFCKLGENVDGGMGYLCEAPQRSHMLGSFHGWSLCVIIKTMPGQPCQCCWWCGSRWWGLEITCVTYHQVHDDQTETVIYPGAAGCEHSVPMCNTVCSLK